MADNSQLQDLHCKITDILSIPTLPSFSRALTVVEEYLELANAYPTRAPEDEELILICNSYRVLCTSNISRLAAQDSAYEHERYARRPKSKDTDNVANSRKRQGIVFDVDKGEHVEAALESLQLEEFLEQQEQQEQQSSKICLKVNEGRV
ncbi:hypothetical protein GGR51DRAFT_562972 [Nemania sp. FL0031]|nr:hypothetical protein GGR51DRAFT_562972 [Nemania sp. FL0031]